MKFDGNIKKALVVVSPESINAHEPMSSSVIRRAVDLAVATGCELELLEICFDGSLEDSLFTSKSEMESRRNDYIDARTIRLAEMAARLKTERVEVSYEVRWDSPRTDAILRKIAQSDPDIVLKQAREHSYWFGVVTNTDWELARRSPSHIWFVNEETGSVDRIVAAVGNTIEKLDDVTSSTDHDVLRAAARFGDAFSADVYPVNAYQVPQGQAATAVAGVAGTAPGLVENPSKSRVEVVKKHRDAVEALAQFNNVDKKNVHICEGQPDTVIPGVAEQLDADLIVMGSTSLGRMERLWNPVTVEPVLSESPCDILVIREPSLEGVPQADKFPVRGVTLYDVEHAITNPSEAFESPRDVVGMSNLSVDFRERVLDAWEHDLRAEMKIEDEGGTTGRVKSRELHEILTAKSMLQDYSADSTGRKLKRNAA
ncbi:MAG: universal stress protein [Woeseiaceae bacterium]|nr:universal stress protein [Woeseiaceae bacterium]